MRGAMRLNVELPAAEIDCGLSCNCPIRQDGCAPISAQKIAHSCTVKFTSLRDGLRERSMADELRVVPCKCRAAQNVVGMDMRDDHIAYRQIGSGADGLAKREPVGKASTGVYDRDRLAANSEADIRDGILVGGGCDFGYADANEQARGHLVDF